MPKKKRPNAPRQRLPSKAVEGEVSARRQPSPHLTGANTLDIARPTVDFDQGGPPENAMQHRSVLLYAMQDPLSRSFRAVAAAMGIAEGTIRNWALRWDWAGRIDREGSAGQARACQLYRTQYLGEDGLARVKVVEPRMTIPFLTTSPPPVAPLDGNPTTVGEIGRVLRATETAEDQGKPPLPQNKVVESTAAVLAKMRKGVEVMIGTYLQQLNTPKGREKLASELKPSDLLRLVDGYQKLSGVLGIDTSGVSGVPGVSALEPTYRVQLAAINGTSVEDAMLEDAEELVVIHRALRERRREAEREEEALRRVRNAQGLPGPGTIREVV